MIGVKEHYKKYTPGPAEDETLGGGGMPWPSVASM